MKSTLLSLVVALVSVPLVAGATSVESVTFEELVRSAQQIFVGQVVAVESFRADIGRGPRIRTRVTFSIDDAIRGKRVVSVLEFLGGTVGELTQEVAGMPHFVVGEQYVVFAREGDRWVNPVVGFTQGLLRVSRGARDGMARVLTADGAPLASASALGRPGNRVSASIILPITLSTFVSQIREEIARQAR
jgi:hypothetical protein